MALSEQQRQKKLAKKKQKRASVVKKVITSMTMGKAAAYAKYPIHECLIPSNLFESGIGEVVVARRISSNSIAMGAFVVDVFCLGVKDAMFKVFSEQEYENLKFQFFDATHRTFEKIHQTCAKKLVVDLVAYAQDLGLSPHSDYNNVKNIFGDIEVNACLENYTYGKDGMPFYVNGPYESPTKIRNILTTLEKKCGKDGFKFIAKLHSDDDDDFF